MTQVVIYGDIGDNWTTGTGKVIDENENTKSFTINSASSSENTVTTSSGSYYDNVSG